MTLRRTQAHLRFLIGPDLVPQTAARAIMASCRGVVSVRDMAQACGWTSTHTAWYAMNRARETGLVDFDDHHAKTFHPTFGVVVGPWC